MKRSIIFLSMLTSVCAVALHGADDLPKRLNADRFTAMLNQSPFAVATAAVPAATPNFAKDLYVANAARTPEADFVTIISTADRNLKEYVSTKGPNEHAYSISNIEWSDQPGGTKVTISKDGQFAILPFNQALMTPMVPTGGPQNAGVVPPAVAAPVPGNLPRPGAVPTPVPHTRPIIQRNPGQVTPIPQPNAAVPQYDQ